MIRHHLAPLLLAAILPLASCSRTPPPEDRVQASATVAPPAPRHEERGQAPRSGYVWIPGYWNWVNERHVWVPGYWSMPPAGFSTWEPPHWIKNGQEWVLVRGKWK